MNASVIRYGKRTTVKFFQNFERIDLQKLFNKWTKYSMAHFEIGIMAGEEDFVAYHFRVSMDWNTCKWKIIRMDTVFVPAKKEVA